MARSTSKNPMSRASPRASPVALAACASWWIAARSSGASMPTLAKKNRRFRISTQASANGDGEPQGDQEAHKEIPAPAVIDKRHGSEEGMVNQILPHVVLKKRVVQSEGHRGEQHARNENPDKFPGPPPEREADAAP